MGNMTWNFDQQSSGGQKAEFTKFPVGVTRVRVVDEAPHVRWVHWMPQFRRSVNCPGKGCPIDEIRRQQKANGEPYTYNMSRRFAMQVINHETGKLEIMEQGVTFFEDLRDLMTDLQADGKTLNDVVLKVRRRGQGKDDTSYRVDIDEEAPMSPNDEALIKDKLDLNEYFKPNPPEQILALLNVQANSPQEYQEKWVEIMSEGESKNDDGDLGEEIEIR